MKNVWVFNGANSQFPSGVFNEIEKAEAWIGHNKLNGTLTAYPVDVGVFDWAISLGHFTPRDDSQRASKFIERFSSANQEHHHYENGRKMA